MGMELTLIGETSYQTRAFVENIVRIMAQYIVKLVSMRGELDSVLRAAYCHEGENYLALMEYYTPEEHGMVPFTRI